jgi:hypothetical protein
MAITIRPVIRSDFSIWSKLWEGYKDPSIKEGFQEKIETNWESFFESKEHMHALVAEENKKLIGVTLSLPS